MEYDMNKIIRNFSAEVRNLMKANLVCQYLFGSTAKGTADSESDVDVLIIVKKLSYEQRKALSILASEYSLNYGIHISPIVKEAKVWEKNRCYQTLFYQEIERDGILL